MNDDVSITHFKGWHGADEKDAEEILASAFKESEETEKKKHWLGEGVYFFTSGVGSPLNHAMNWAKSEAHKRENRRFAVLSAQISVNEDQVLDLTKNEGLEIFNEHRVFVLRQIRLQNRAFKHRNRVNFDSKVFEHIKQKADIEVIICNMYVQFLKDRIQKIDSRIPNCTFLCVSNPTENIDHSTVKIVHSGNI